MITDCRNQWESNFLFYFVQVAPFSYGGNEQKKLQKLRNAQGMALKKKTGMVVTLDIGNEFNINPSEKQTVGNRLAGLSLVNDYGKNLVASGSLFKKAKTEGNKLTVQFENVDSGLMAHKERLTNFEIAEADKNYNPANVKIVERTVVATNPIIKNPVYVRYAWSDIRNVTFFNKEGFPASTFISEE